MRVYICQCYSLNSSHPYPPPLRPQVCSLLGSSGYSFLILDQNSVNSSFWNVSNFNVKFETISTKFVCSFWKICIGIPFEWVFYPLINLQHIALVVSIIMVEWFMQNFQMLTSNITNHIHWFHYQSHQKSLIYWESFMFTVADVSLPKF